MNESNPAPSPSPSPPLPPTPAPPFDHKAAAAATTVITPASTPQMRPAQEPATGPGLVDSASTGASAAANGANGAGVSDAGPRPKRATAEEKTVQLEKTLSGVVKVFCTRSSPNFAMGWVRTPACEPRGTQERGLHCSPEISPLPPFMCCAMLCCAVVWCAVLLCGVQQMMRQTSSTASGFIISGRRIITNAHAIQRAASVRVRKHGDPTKYRAAVLFVGHQCDLAVLEVTDKLAEQFWKGTTELTLCPNLPMLQSSVLVIGCTNQHTRHALTRHTVAQLSVCRSPSRRTDCSPCAVCCADPTGADNVSITKGVVSRINVNQVQRYSTACTRTALTSCHLFSSPLPFHCCVCCAVHAFR
jgi:hypothetical protein